MNLISLTTTLIFFLWPVLIKNQDIHSTTENTIVTVTSTANATNTHAPADSTMLEFSQNFSKLTGQNVTNKTRVTTTSPTNSSSLSTAINSSEVLPDYIRYCPSNVQCQKLGGDCIDCDFDEDCQYGKNLSVICRPKEMVVCLGSQNFTRWYHCQYCYQVSFKHHICTNDTSCRVNGAPRQKYQANCSVPDNILCLGRRKFYKMLQCNWTSGKRWSTALILSITLGGFGADRFYLGLWREGIGKLFSFGGLGVWTLVDVVLVATGYITPADGSLYIW